jgi:hypothetical protein
MGAVNCTAPPPTRHSKIPLQQRHQAGRSLLVTPAPDRLEDCCTLHGECSAYYHVRFKLASVFAFDRPDPAQQSMCMRMRDMCRMCGMCSELFIKIPTKAN